MDINSRLSLSYYKNILTLDEERQIYISQHINSKKLYIKKNLKIYNKAVYEYLFNNPIKHTPKIFELYEEDNTLTVIEEYISGDTIEQLLENGKKFTDIEIVDIVWKLCTIVSDFHHCSPSIIHRDIKPSNIIITASSEVYLLDFNAAKYDNCESTKSEDTTLLGTKGYAAPEQYGFGVSTVQTDIYAMGMLINTLVSGTFTTEIKKDSIFFELISKCTRLDAKQRPKNINEVMHILAPLHQKLHPSSTVDETADIFSHTSGSFLPPGFRSKRLSHMMAAGFYYALFTIYAITARTKNSTSFVQDIPIKIAIFLIFMSYPLLTFNYRNIQSYFPICTSENRIIKYLGIIALNILVSFAILVILGLCQAIAA